MEVDATRCTKGEGGRLGFRPRRKGKKQNTEG